MVPDSTRLTPDNAFKMGGLAVAARQPPFLPRPLAQRSASPRSGASSATTPPRPLAAPARERWAEGQPAAWKPKQRDRTHSNSPEARPASRNHRKPETEPETGSDCTRSLNGAQIGGGAEHRVDRCPAPAPGISLRMRALEGGEITWAGEWGRKGREPVGSVWLKQILGP